MRLSLMLLICFLLLPCSALAQTVVGCIPVLKHTEGNTLKYQATDKPTQSGLDNKYESRLVRWS